MTNVNDLAAEEAKRRFWLYEPYTKQKEFHRFGATRRERVFSAGNQLGKTIAGAHETAFHLTGMYPDWWEGRRFKKHTNGWASSNTSENTRDNAQLNLFGYADQIGTGVIHKDYIVDYSKARGVSDSLDTVWVKNVNGSVSTIQFKSYERGREKWQGATLDWVWFDEEPPRKIYTEGLSRTNATGGLVYLTFTPLLGMSDVVLRFWREADSDRSLTLMGLNDALHISAEQKERIISSYPAHERRARTDGIPTMGSGRIFPLSVDEISCEVPEIKRWWVRIVGIDIGWDHPTAVVWIAWDRDTDTVYVYDCYKQSETKVLEHAAMIRQKGEWIPVAWPHDALQHDKASGQQIAEQYRKYGVNMLRTKAEFTDGSNGVEAGLAEMLDRMATNRLKVSSHLSEWFEEFELYHRDEGKIVKERDDLMSATRYALMMLRYAITEPREELEYSEVNEDDRSDVGGY